MAAAAVMNMQGAAGCFRLIPDGCGLLAVGVKHAGDGNGFPATGEEEGDINFLSTL
jgi:hypothetical protein